MHIKNNNTHSLYTFYQNKHIFFVFMFCSELLFIPAPNVEDSPKDVRTDSPKDLPEDSVTSQTGAAG